jgi:hypothetical protein
MLWKISHRFSYRWCTCPALVCHLNEEIFFFKMAHERRERTWPKSTTWTSPGFEPWTTNNWTGWFNHCTMRRSFRHYRITIGRWTRPSDDLFHCLNMPDMQVKKGHSLRHRSAHPALAHSALCSSGTCSSGTLIIRHLLIRHYIIRHFAHPALAHPALAHPALWSSGTCSSGTTYL